MFQYISNRSVKEIISKKRNLYETRVVVSLQHTLTHTNTHLSWHHPFNLNKNIPPTWEPNFIQRPRQSHHNYRVILSRDERGCQTKGDPDESYIVSSED